MMDLNLYMSMKCDQTVLMDLNYTDNDLTETAITIVINNHYRECANATVKSLLVSKVSSQFRVISVFVQQVLVLLLRLSNPSFVFQIKCQFYSLSSHTCRNSSVCTSQLRGATQRRRYSTPNFGDFSTRALAPSCHIQLLWGIVTNDLLNHSLQLYMSEYLIFHTFRQRHHRYKSPIFEWVMGDLTNRWHLHAKCYSSSKTAPF